MEQNSSYRLAMALPTEPHAVRKNLFGGQGTVQIWDLLGRLAAPPFAAILWCELEPGGRVGKHRQEECPELVLGIEGDGQASVDGELVPLGQGDVVHLPLGSVLAIENRSDAAPLRYLIVKAAG